MNTAKYLFFLVVVFLFLSSSVFAEAEEITAADYANFLNHVAIRDTSFFYDQEMASDAPTACIVRLGHPGSWHYQVIAGRENFPIRYLNFFDKEIYETEIDCSLLDDEEIGDSSLKSNRNSFEVGAPLQPALMLAIANTSSSSDQWSGRDVAFDVGAVAVLFVSGMMFENSSNGVGRERKTFLPEFEDFQEVIKDHPDASGVIVSEEGILTPQKADRRKNLDEKNKKENIAAKKAFKAAIARKYSSEIANRFFPELDPAFSLPDDTPLSAKQIREISDNLAGVSASEKKPLGSSEEKDSDLDDAFDSVWHDVPDIEDQEKALELHIAKKTPEDSRDFLSLICRAYQRLLFRISNVKNITPLQQACWDGALVSYKRSLLAQMNVIDDEDKIAASLSFLSIMDQQLLDPAFVRHEFGSNISIQYYQIAERYEQAAHEIKKRNLDLAVRRKQTADDYFNNGEVNWNSFLPADNGAGFMNEMFHDKAIDDDYLSLIVLCDKKLLTGVHNRELVTYSRLAADNFWHAMYNEKLAKHLHQKNDSSDASIIDQNAISALPFFKQAAFHFYRAGKTWLKIYNQEKKIKNPLQECENIFLGNRALSSLQEIAQTWTSAGRFYEKRGTSMKKFSLEKEMEDSASISSRKSSQMVFLALENEPLESKLVDICLRYNEARFCFKQAAESFRSESNVRSFMLQKNAEDMLDRANAAYNEIQNSLVVAP